jgi:hypothetical protein
VTIELARIVGRSGRVVGVDRDGEALEIARTEVDRAGVQVQFVCADANAPPAQSAVFDLGYARLLVSHLTEPVAALRHLCTALHEDTVDNPMATVHQRLFLTELLDNLRPAILDTGAATAARARSGPSGRGPTPPRSLRWTAPPPHTVGRPGSRAASFFKLASMVEGIYVSGWRFGEVCGCDRSQGKE